ncbi:putative trimethyllysine dioxygenase TmlH [Aspergillus stella-maris]|uniref:putative trimethyllysine dioxygenase TmlH n=1 Tax=Aspergillus stella-maris TaxID=1810926 RepID=UPI003CCCCBEA
MSRSLTPRLFRSFKVVGTPIRIGVRRQSGAIFSSPQEHIKTRVSVDDSSEYGPEGLIRPVSLPLSVTQKRTAEFGQFWLRENCRCDECMSKETRQRSVDTFSIPPNIKVTHFVSGNQGVRVTFSDGHVSTYEHEWLKIHEPTKQTELRKLEWKPKFRPFKAINPTVRDPEYPTVPYKRIMAAHDEGLRLWLTKIHEYGFCFVEDVPVTPEATEALLKRIAFIRHTHYGGFWDFTADMTYKDTAYTSEALGAHTDNTYFTDPARLQLFHLLSHEGGEGGSSLLVDGFKAAWALAQEDWTHAQILNSVPQPFHSSGNDYVCITPAKEFPVFNDHEDAYGWLHQIRWNNYDRAPKSNWTLKQQEMWYRAAEHFDRIIHRPEMEIWTQLEPGTALIFDNWRMLHGRSAFTGKRRMCGGYINNDDFLSRLRLLKYGREHVLRYLGSYKGPHFTKDNPNLLI